MSIRALFNAKAAMKERPDFHDASPQDVGDDDSYHSDGGDAVAQLGALTKRKSLSGHAAEPSSTIKKSRHRTTDVFIKNVKEDVGLVFDEAFDISMNNMLNVFVNILVRWQRHACKHVDVQARSSYRPVYATMVRRKLSG